MVPTWHEAIVKMFEKHFPNGMWHDEDVAAVEREMQQSQNSGSLAELLRDPQAFEELFLVTQISLTTQTRMAMYCGEEKARELFQKWLNSTEDQELSAEVEQQLIDDAEKSSSLRKLNLADNPIASEGLEKLAGSPYLHLTKLDLSGCGIISTKVMQSPNALTSLTTFILNDNDEMQLDGIAASNFPYLKTLGLARHAISEPIEKRAQESGIIISSQERTRLKIRMLIKL